MLYGTIKLFEGVEATIEYDLSKYKFVGEGFGQRVYCVLVGDEVTRLRKLHWALSKLFRIKLC